MRRWRLYLSIVVVAAVGGTLIALWSAMGSLSRSEYARADAVPESAPAASDTATELVTDPRQSLRAPSVPGVPTDTSPIASNATPNSAHLSGRVSWPDNSPAVGAEVRARRRSADSIPRGNVRETKAVFTDANGEFEIPPLDGSSFLVEASATANVATSEHSASQAPIPWIATGAPVQLGERISLVLQKPSDIVGRVIDETGAPVQRFGLTATYPSVNQTLRFAIPRSNRKERFDTADGSFMLHSLQQGMCFITADADAYTSIDGPITVKLPDTREPITIVLHRAGTISGRVVDPDGEPVEGAQVTASINGDDLVLSRSGQRSNRTSSDESGAFVLECMPPGTLDLTAEHDQWAASEPESVALAPLKTIDDLRLVLRVGGTLSGEIHDEGDEPVGGRKVSLYELRKGGLQVGREMKSDASGNFKFDHLTPGSYRIFAARHPAPAETVAQSGDRFRNLGYASDSGPPDPLTMSPVQVRDRENTHVVLGLPSESSLRLYGRVTRHGAPARGVFVGVAHDGSSAVNEGQTNDAGRYELTLDAPGAVTVWIGDDSSGGSGTEFAAVIPETRAYELDLAIPTGGIRGIVLDPSGVPVPKASVQLANDQATSVTPWHLFSASKTVDADEHGRFEFSHLAPGSYAIGTDGRLSGFATLGNARPAEARRRYGRSIRGGLTVTTDTILDGVEITLAPPGTIVGTVVDTNGLPVAAANVYVRDARGELLHRASPCRTDLGGNFRYADIAVGPHTVIARARELVSEDRTAIDVREGEESALKLVLKPGYMLHIAVLDSAERAVQSHLSVRDEHGWEFAYVLDTSAWKRFFEKGQPFAATIVGPLASGKYRVTATTGDGKSVTTPVTLTGQTEHKLTLRLD